MVAANIVGASVSDLVLLTTGVAVTTAVVQHTSPTQITAALVSPVVRASTQPPDATYDCRRYIKCRQRCGVAVALVVVPRARFCQCVVPSASRAYAIGVEAEVYDIGFYAADFRVHS